MKDSIAKVLADLLAKYDETRDDTELVVVVARKSNSGTVRFVKSDDLNPGDSPHQKIGQATATDAEKTEKQRSLHDFPLFSPFDIAILRAASHEWQSAAELAQGCGEKNNANFYAALRSLANRGILLSHPTHGWRLCSSITPEEIDRLQ